MLDLATKNTPQGSATTELAHKALTSKWLTDLNLGFASTSNEGANELAFQRWMKFKEAYSPKFVSRCLEEFGTPSQTCLDPFGGSGTTAITSRMMGFNSVSIEVNPFLADLVQAKLTRLDAVSIAVAVEEIFDRANDVQCSVEQAYEEAPRSFIEPGVNGKFVFWRGALDRLLQLRMSIEKLENSDISRLMKVLLASTVVALSNTTVNGKGRKYRRKWQNRPVTANDVDRAFIEKVNIAVGDLVKYAGDVPTKHDVLVGDCRKEFANIPANSIDLSIFSPPYPNSFDYTDVYNLELWVLGYLKTRKDNTKLRHSTLRSHVQITFEWSTSHMKSETLRATREELETHRSALWDKRIPEMISAYFDDLAYILSELYRAIKPGGYVVAAVGDSQYAGITIRTAEILSELAEQNGFSTFSSTVVRSMRTSSQSGGAKQLSETKVVLRSNK